MKTQQIHATIANAILCYYDNTVNDPYSVARTDYIPDGDMLEAWSHMAMVSNNKVHTHLFLLRLPNKPTIRR